MGLDVARGLALLGMAIAHVGGMPDLEWNDPSTWGGVVHGRSSILFAVLAGISITLMTGRTSGLAPQDVTAARLRLVGRGGAIFLIGLVLEFLGTPVAIILTFYGVLFIAAIPFLRWSARRLLIVAAVIGVVGPVLLALVQVLSNYSSGSGVSLAIAGTFPATVWLAMLLAGMGLGRWGLESSRAAVTLLVVGAVLAGVGYGAAAAFGGADGEADWDDSWVDEEPMDDGLYGVPGDQVDVSELVCDLYGEEWVSCYPADYTDEATMSAGASSVVLDLGGIGAGSVVNSSVIVDTGGSGSLDEDYTYGDMLREAAIAQVLWGAVISDYPHSGGVAEVLGSGGFAIAVIGLCLLLTRPLRWVLIPLAALGSMPLTVYSVHIVVIMIGMGGPMGPGPLERIPWAWFCLGLTAFATVWALAWGRGPLERLVGRAADAMTRVRVAPAKPE